MKDMHGASFKGGTITKEDFDLDEFGLYTIKDPSVPEQDYFLTEYTVLNKPLYARWSEEGDKWFMSRPNKTKKSPVKRGKKK